MGERDAPITDLGELLKHQAQHLPPRTIVAYFRREELSEGDRLVVERHLEVCARCSAQLRLQQRFADELAPTRPAGAPEAPSSWEGFGERLRAFLWQPALAYGVAAAVALLAVGRLATLSPEDQLLGRAEPQRVLLSETGATLLVQGALGDPVILELPGAPDPGSPYEIRIRQPESGRTLSARVLPGDPLSLEVPSGWLRVGRYGVELTTSDAGLEVVGDRFALEVIE